MATDIIKLKYFIANNGNGPRLCVDAKVNDQHYMRTLVDCKDGEQAYSLKEGLSSAYERAICRIWEEMLAR